MGCQDALEVSPASQFSDGFLDTPSGVNALLNSAYDNIQYTHDPGANRIYLEETVTDVFINFRGFLNGNLQPYQDFTFNANSAYLYDNLWQKCYNAIRDANALLDVVPQNQELSDEEKTQIVAEAHFIRGLAYKFLYGWFGPVPLIDKVFRSPDEEFNVPRAEESILTVFIEDELRLAAGTLPETQELYGKATQGAALGVLTKFYLQTKNWQAAAVTAQQVIDLGQYALQGDYAALFALENEGNSEMIFAFPSIPLEGNGNIWVANALPPQYPTTIFNTATQVCVPVEFYNTFAEDDQRKELLLTEYVSNQGETVDLLTGVEFQNPRSLKYAIDLRADSRDGGADFILIRYADILLARAEALVMASGAVDAEALDLLNQVRTRAGLAPYGMADVPEAAAFIDRLIQERAWEFYSEGKRREDLIRHNQLVTNAVARGKKAEPYHVRFPIPQGELDANPNLEQNEGY